MTLFSKEQYRMDVRTHILHAPTSQCTTTAFRRIRNNLEISVWIIDRLRGCCGFFCSVSLNVHLDLGPCWVSANAFSSQWMQTSSSYGKRQHLVDICQCWMSLTEIYTLVFGKFQPRYILCIVTLRQPFYGKSQGMQFVTLQVVQNFSSHADAGLVYG